MRRSLLRLSAVNFVENKRSVRESCSLKKNASLFVLKDKRNYWDILKYFRGSERVNGEVEGPPHLSANTMVVFMSNFRAQDSCRLSRLVLVKAECDI